MEENDIEKPLISQPLPPSSEHVTITRDRLSRIKDLNRKLESLRQEDSKNRVIEIRKNINDNKKHISEKKEKLGSESEIIEKLKIKKDSNKCLEEINKQTENIDKLKANIDKYDQTKAFLSILIEKAVNSYYPSLKAEGNIHTKLIQSVEEDQNFEYGTHLLSQISQA